NVFELLKRYAVETKLVEVRPAVIIDVRGLKFDSAFVTDNADFLREKLIDQSLAEQLPLAIQGILPPPTPIATLQARAVDAAKEALALLFEVPNIFHLLPLLTGGDPNHPGTSFDASIAITIIPPFANWAIDPVAGLRHALDKHVNVIFTSVNFFYAAWRRAIASYRLDTEAIDLATALAADVGPRWEAFVGDI